MGSRIVADERLERLGDRFIFKSIGRMLSITFEQYQADPDHYDELIDALEAGHALQRVDGGFRIIECAVA